MLDTQTSGVAAMRFRSAIAAALTITISAFAASGLLVWSGAARLDTAQGLVINIPHLFSLVWLMFLPGVAALLVAASLHFTFHRNCASWLRFGLSGSSMALASLYLVPFLHDRWPSLALQVIAVPLTIGAGFLSGSLVFAVSRLLCFALGERKAQSRPNESHPTEAMG